MCLAFSFNTFTYKTYPQFSNRLWCNGHSAGKPVLSRKPLTRLLHLLWNLEGEDLEREMAQVVFPTRSHSHHPAEGVKALMESVSHQI